jgi:uncharacterized protein YbjT (DUF2867 family)
MPMLVVGADTSVGDAIVERALTRDGQVRAFVSDDAAGARLRARSVKVALGDVSDSSHVGSAALGCFSVALVAEAALDGRDMAFASDPDAVIASWIRAVVESEVTRVVLVAPGPHPTTQADLAAAPESAVVDTTGLEPEEVAERVLAIDDAAAI